ncbi:TorF family putative porin [Euryhalocaulis caribicus]|uniref:TorF family putative porin n=1 Tax=Euryhalocaulis caribicus TaxID=1161401 RepID=UPI0009DC03CB|nr:TorF family putative porin [Euryhalocaulis caribicus]
MYKPGAAKLKKYLAVSALLAFSTALSAPALAQEEGSEEGGFGSLSGKLKLASNYMYRGLSVSDDGPQLQGSFTWAHDSGFYAGVWASNTSAGGEGNSVEIDPFVGFAGTVGDSGVGYDIGFWYYSFPGSVADLDYWEIYGILSYTLGEADLGASVWYAKNYFGDDFFPDTPSYALQTTASYPLPIGEGVSVSGKLGRQIFDESAALTAQDYTYYDIGVSKAWEAVTLDLRWHDADGVKPDLAAPENVGSLVASIVFSF